LPVVGALDSPSNILCSAISMDYPGGTRHYLEDSGLNWSFVINEPYNYRGSDFLPCNADIAFHLWQLENTNVKWNFTPIGEVSGQNVIFYLNKNNNGGPNSYACIAYGNWVDEYGNKGKKPVVFINGYTEKQVRAFVSTIRITTYTIKDAMNKILNSPPI
jgi:hypothetical protein